MVAWDVSDDSDALDAYGVAVLADASYEVASDVQETSVDFDVVDACVGGAYAMDVADAVEPLGGLDGLDDLVVQAEQAV